MEKPNYTPNFMGEIMMDCWKKEPKDRPSFGQIEAMITDNMESSVSSYYSNLNAPYEKFNDEITVAPKAERFGLAKLLNKKPNVIKLRSQSSGYGARYTQPPERSRQNSRGEIIVPP